MTSVLYLTLLSIVSAYSLNRGRCRVDRSGNDSVGCPARGGTFSERNFDGSYKSPRENMRDYSDDWDDGEWAVMPSSYESWTPNSPDSPMAMPMPMNMNTAGPSNANIVQNQEIDIRIQGSGSSNGNGKDFLLIDNNSEVVEIPVSAVKNGAEAVKEKIEVASAPTGIASAQVIEPLATEQETIQYLNDLALFNANPGTVVQGVVPLRESITVVASETQTVVLEPQPLTAAVILEQAPVQISSAGVRNVVPVQVASAPVQQQTPIIIASAVPVVEEIQFISGVPLNQMTVNPTIIASNPQVDYVAAFLSGTVFEGQAKWYDNWMEVTGSCGYNLAGRGDLFVGLPLRLMPLSADPTRFYTPNNALCGTCALVTNVKTGASVKVLVVDTAYDDGYNVILSAPAFVQIGDAAVGVLEVTYAQTAC